MRMDSASYTHPEMGLRHEYSVRLRSGRYRLGRGGRGQSAQRRSGHRRGGPGGGPARQEQIHPNPGGLHQAVPQRDRLGLPDRTAEGARRSRDLLAARQGARRLVVDERDDVGARIRRRLRRVGGARRGAMVLRRGARVLPPHRERHRGLALRQRRRQRSHRPVARFPSAQPATADRGLAGRGAPVRISRCATEFPCTGRLLRDRRHAAPRRQMQHRRRLPEAGDGPQKPHRAHRGHRDPSRLRRNPGGRRGISA